MKNPRKIPVTLLLGGTGEIVVIGTIVVGCRVVDSSWHFDKWQFTNVSVSVKQFCKEIVINL